MRICRYISVFLIVICASMPLVVAQTMDFAHIDNTMGLANNQVECIKKDSRGFMWFGTDTGLNRFDGMNFRTFKNDPDNIESIPFNRVAKIYEDAAGNLWLIEDGAMAYYIYEEDRFIRNVDSLLQTMNMPPTAIKIYLDEKKNIYSWYDGDGIYRYDVKTGETVHYSQSVNSTDLSPGTIT